MAEVQNRRLKLSLDISAEVQNDNGFNISVDLSVATDRVTALYGASGSGKTTLLRLITGLTRQAGIEVKFNQRTWQSGDIFLPVHQRKIGFVFQQLNLFPHLSVSGNLEFAIRRNKQNRGLSRDDVIEMLDLRDLLETYPTYLSGGEQQRVAIGRALLSNPQLLAMDEPLGSIDSVAKRRIIPYLQRLHNTLKIPVIYVSHALDEVLELADNVILFETGKAIRQQSVFDFAITGPDVNLAQGASIIRCRVTGKEPDNQLTILNFENQTMYLAASNHCPGESIRIRIPSRDVSLAINRPEASSILNILEGTVKEINNTITGPTIVVIVSCGQQELLARITRKSLVDLNLRIGQRVYAQVKGVALMVNNDP